MEAALGAKILNVLRITFLGAYNHTTAILGAIYLISLWRLFVKCGVKGWWALVPVARVYKLALCADREQEGRTLTTLNAANILANVIMIFTERGSIIYFGCALIDFALFFAMLIYEVRVFRGLARMFNRRKLWVLLWLVAEWFPIAPLLWGFSKKYQPLWKAEEIRDDDVEEFFSGRKAAVLQEGLTITFAGRFRSGEDHFPECGERI